MMSSKRTQWCIGITAAAIVACVTLGLNLASSYRASGTNKEMKHHVEIQIGEMPKHLLDRYGDRVFVNSKNQSVYGVSWYQFDWPNFDGEVGVRNGGSTLMLNQVGSVQGPYDSNEYPAEGISEYSINLGLFDPALGPKDLISHQDARTAFYGLLRRVRMAGWIRYIAADAPRLSGAETFTYQASGIDNARTYSMDALEMPSFDQWMAFKDGVAWEFYKNGVYMSITIYRDSNRMDPNKPGAYFLSMDLTSRDEYQRKNFEGKERSRWKELYPQVRQREREGRIALEATLASKGYSIDKSYQNPDE